MTSFSIRRTIVTGFVAALAIICFFTLYTYLNMQKGADGNHRLNTTLKSLQLTEHVYDNVRHLEARLKEYITSGNKTALDSYYAKISDVKASSTAIRSFEGSDAERKEKNEALLGLVDKRLAFYQNIIDTFQASGPVAANTALESAASRREMLSMYSQIEEIEENDRSTLDAFNLQQEKIARRTTNLFALLAGIFIIFLIGFFFIVRRDVRRRMHAELDSQVQQKTVAFKDILDRISDGFIAFDRNWNYVYINTAASKLVGRNDLLGKNIWKEFPNSEDSEFYKEAHRAVEKQEYVSTEVFYEEYKAWLAIHIYPSEGGVSVHFRDITLKKNIENELNQAIERFNIVAHATNDVLWEADLIKNTLWWNDNFYEKFGYIKTDKLESDKSWEKYLHPDDKARVLNAVGAAIADKNQTTWTDQYRFARADGAYLDVYDRCYILRDNNGNAYRMIGSMADLSSLFDTRKELQKTEERYRNLVDSIDGIVWEADATSFQFRFVSRQAERLLGYPIEEWTSDPDFWVRHIHPDDHWAIKYCKDSVEARKPHEFEYRMTAKDGKVVWLRDIVSFYEDDKGRMGLRGLMVDITEKKAIHEAISQSEEKYRTLVEQASDGIFIADPTGRFIVINSSGCKMSQYTEEELKGMTIYHLADPEDLKTNPFKFAEMTAERGARSERKMRTKDGSIIDIEVNAKFLSDGRFLAFIRDITDRKKAEEGMKKARDLADKLIDSLPGVFYFYDESGKFIRWNKQLETVTGYSPEEIARMHPTDFFEGEEEKFHIAQHAKDVFALGEHATEANLMSKDGTQTPYYFKAVLLTYEGKPCVVGTGIDITERVKAEKKLQESLLEIRQLTEYIQNIREEERAHIAREIHDELGQQLTVLKMDVSWLNKRVGDDETIKQKLYNLTNMLDGTVKTVRRISSELRPSLLDDLGLIAAMDWHLREFGTRTSIETEFVEPEFDIFIPPAVRTGMYRIFQESLTNVARHASAKKVKVSLLQNGSHFVLSIEDNGIGFDKQRKKDKTLGILGMKERTAMMGGTYEIISMPGRGTVVVVSVPIQNVNELS